MKMREKESSFKLQKITKLTLEEAEYIAMLFQIDFFFFYVNQKYKTLIPTVWLNIDSRVFDYSSRSLASL